MKPLARLASLYHLLEQTHRGTLEQAHAALRETEKTVAQQATLEDSMRRLAHTSLATAERQEWLLHASQRELAFWNLAALEPLREQRRALRDAAESSYRNSLREREQIDAVLERAQAVAERQEARREQAEADDRFLARARWLSRMKRCSYGAPSDGSLRASSSAQEAAHDCGSDDSSDPSGDA